TLCWSVVENLARPCTLLESVVSDMICVKLNVIASEAKQSQLLRLLRFARNDIYMLWVICQTSYEWLWKLEEVEEL
ncbi:MAG: hypothetical protein AAFY21_19465, partial [Cyanobacteria bacterium J06641_2]